ncbi:MAG: hypothetical protein ACK5PW_14785 [Burkholderiales bacterium]
MTLTRRTSRAMPFARIALVMVASALSACSSSTDPAASAGTGVATPASVEGSMTLAGTVAIGAPMSGATLKIVDADGVVVVSGLTVGADGRYAGVALTGKAPWTLEACGHAGSDWTCLSSVVQSAGTGNVTPLTDAVLRLAGSASAAGTGTVSDAIRTGLAALLADAGLPADFDFVTGALDAGSRGGYDRLLDVVGVSVGEDGKSFVQISPRLGSGNLYLESGGPAVGALALDPKAAALPLAGLETLFRNMSASLAGASACAAESTGLRRSLAADARLTMGSGDPMVGPDAVAQALCEYFGSGDDGQSPMWGSTMVSPKLGRCDFSRAAPVCGVSFALRSPEGEVRAVGAGMGATYTGGAWRFVGDLDVVSIRAEAKMQRDRRVDGPTVVDQYTRALAFEVPALDGLACAKVSQRDAAGAAVTVGFYKRHGSGTPDRLSLWTQDSFSNLRSVDAAVGTTRSTDDSWIALPEGAEGDAVIRNFYRGGRTVQVDLYADAACTAAFQVDGRSRFDVEVAGVPPVWSAMPSLPWPDLTPATASALKDLVLAGSATGSLAAAWTFPRGGLGIEESYVCSERACGGDSPARIGVRTVRPGAASVTIPLVNGSTPLVAEGFRMLTLGGRNAEGSGLQSNFLACPGVAPGQGCQ